MSRPAPRSLTEGPRIVAIGGGTGQPVLLRGLKEHTRNLTAVVAVADDGGSSGRLREELGIAPVGDLRNCIAALADAEPTMARLLQYRFPAQGRGSEALPGHAFGNLLIAALSEIEGDFEEGVRQANRVLAVRGQVVPAAPVALTLHAELADGSRLVGQSRIARASGIRRVWIEPQEARASAEALAAIAAADLIVLAPGSLYTSLLPSLLIPELRQALLAAQAPRVYVANVATQVGETQGFALSDHLAALVDHDLEGAVDVVLANDDRRLAQPATDSASGRRLGRPAAEAVSGRGLALPTAEAVSGPDPAPVRVDLAGRWRRRPHLLVEDVADHRDPHHHDPVLLAEALLAVLEAWPAAPLRSPIVRSA